VIELQGYTKKVLFSHALIIVKQKEMDRTGPAASKIRRIML
jgi:hypothetical protein